MSEIEDWVEEQLDAGWSPEELRQTLFSSGYDPRIVDEVVESKKSKGLSKKIKILLGAFVLALILLGTIFMFSISNQESFKRVEIENITYFTVEESKEIGGFSGVLVEDFETSNRHVELSIYNNLSKNIEIRHIKSSAFSTEQCLGLSLRIEPSDSRKVNCTLQKSPNRIFNISVGIVYTKLPDGEKIQGSGGYISGRLQEKTANVTSERPSQSPSNSSSSR